MRRGSWFRFLLGLFGLALASTACTAAGEAQFDALAEALWTAPEAEADAAAAELRRAGPAGMEAALAYAEHCDPALCADQARIQRLDTLCGVRDCRDIRLFWYTDLEAAKATAQVAGKPILSLRLLGRLDEELSCANSRFFRTALYSNREIGALLRDRFVLHWHSVRAVPKVTIDFGNGTTMQQTIAGNSLHYFLDHRGRLVDVLPGLYTPQTFHRELLAAREAATTANGLDDESFAPWAARRHAATLGRLDAGFARAAAAEGSKKTSPGARTRPARMVGSEAISKAFSEAPLVRALDLEVSDEDLDRLAVRRRSGARLDEASRALLLRKHGAVDGEAGQRLIASFEADMALDEVVNESRYRRPILKGLANAYLAATARLDLEDLTSWIYEGVFRDPISDPWMGLGRRDAYAALPLPPPPAVSDAMVN